MNEERDGGGGGGSVTEERRKGEAGRGVCMIGRVLDKWRDRDGR